MRETDEQRMFRETTRKFCEKEIIPRAAEIDATDEFPSELWQRFGELGSLGLGIDEKYGGCGGSTMDFIISAEELARASASVALSIGAHSNLCCYNLFRNGNEEQKMRWLPDLLAGKKIGCLGITEPDNGSDAVGMKTTAVKDGDDYLITGRKMLITNAPIADVFLVYVKTTPEAGPMGISTFLLERGMEGLETTKPFKKMGCKGSPTGGIFMDKVRVPAENLVGWENHGIAVLMSGLDIERVLFAAFSLGIAQRAIELSLKYAKEREQFGRPIAKFQLIQAKIADMYTQYEASRAFVYDVANDLIDMEKGGKGTEIHKRAAASLLFAAEAAEKICYEAVQIHGGWGFTDEYEVSRLYRDVRLGTLGAGTAEIRRIIIARELLGLD